MAEDNRSLYQKVSTEAVEQFWAWPADPEPVAQYNALKGAFEEVIKTKEDGIRGIMEAIEQLGGPENVPDLTDLADAYFDLPMRSWAQVAQVLGLWTITKTFNEEHPEVGAESERRMEAWCDPTTP